MSTAAPLDFDACYRAVASRDTRFDGRFVTAVRTTGVYCRPVCPARTPLARNVEFFRCVETPIRPLIDELSFIKNKQRWGYVFRFGLFEIPQEDFELIQRAMKVDA